MTLCLGRYNTGAGQWAHERGKRPAYMSTFSWTEAPKGQRYRKMAWVREGSVWHGRFRMRGEAEGMVRRRGKTDLVKVFVLRTVTPRHDVIITP